MSNFAPDLYNSHKVKLYYFNFLIIFYVRFKERKAIGRLQLG